MHIVHDVLNQTVQQLFTHDASAHISLPSCNNNSSHFGHEQELKLQTSKRGIAPRD